MAHYAVYIRRSLKREGDADVSDDTQEQVALSRLPADSTWEVIRDSSGRHSGYSADRPGYQRLLALVRARKVAGIAAYDDSRLNRNAENALALFRECSTRGIGLFIDNTPTEERFTPTGEMTYGMVAVVKQHERQAMAKRMRDQARYTFERGGHRGNDPYGYASERDSFGRLLRPRQLKIVPEEAAVVRAIWHDLSRFSLIEVASRLAAQGSTRRGRPWTRDGVKDIARRGRLYLGFVVTKRGMEERPGLHEPILDNQTYSEGIVGIMQRGRGGRRPARFRTYLLRGVIFCECGQRMHGEARVSRGKEWRYYVCPAAYGRKVTEVACAARSVPADEAEGVVLSAVERFRLPATWVDQAREELRRRLGGHRPDLDSAKRTRLETRLVNLRKQFEWGDISERDYRSKMEDTRRQLTSIPDESKLVSFDLNRKVMQDMAENLDKASDAQKARLLTLLVERCVASAGKVQGEAIVWTPPARPFFLGMVPPEGYGGPVPKLDLEWYAREMPG